MNKLLLITILLIIFTGCHENQQWMSKEKSTARKSVLEMTTPVLYSRFFSIHRNSAEGSK